MTGPALRNPIDLVLTRNVVGAPIVVTRPNNVTAYTIGQILGAAVDARITIPIPPTPVDAAMPGFNIIALQIVNNRPITDPTLSLAAMYFLGVPATILADQAAVNLSDADIAKIIFNSGAAAPWTNLAAVATGTGQTFELNAGAFPNGRRAVSFAFSVLNPRVLPGGGALGLYLKVFAAYVPAALETFTLTPIFSYSSRERVLS